MFPVNVLGVERRKVSKSRRLVVSALLRTEDGSRSAFSPTAALRDHGAWVRPPSLRVTCRLDCAILRE
jgi:hypothetical protein